MKENFRGVVVKSWVALPLERLNFRGYNKMIVRKAVEFYSEYRRERCKALHTPEYEKISLNNEKNDKKDAAKEDKVNYERHVNLHPIYENVASIDAKRSWANKTRQFRANANDVKQQDI